MKTKLLALMFLAGGAMFAETRFSIGVNLGGPRYYGPPPVYYSPAPVYAAPVRVIRPPYPGPGFLWVDGYWNRGRYGRAWVPGYWKRHGHVRVAPRYYGYR